MNVVVVAGRLPRPPQERVLPSGDRTVSLDVTVPAEPSTGGRSETVPVTWSGAPASVLRLDAGAEVLVLGRVRRRFFRVGPQTQSRTEVVAERIVPASNARRVQNLLDRALQELDAGSFRRW